MFLCALHSSIVRDSNRTWHKPTNEMLNNKGKHRKVLAATNVDTSYDDVPQNDIDGSGSQK